MMALDHFRSVGYRLEDHWVNPAEYVLNITTQKDEEALKVLVLAHSAVLTQCWLLAVPLVLSASSCSYTRDCPSLGCCWRLQALPRIYYRSHAYETVRRDIAAACRVR